MATFVQSTYNFAPGTAYAGLVVRADLVEARENAEASAEIPFGYAVKQHASNVNGAVLPTVETDVVLGIVCRDHVYSKDIELGSVGLKPGTIMSVLRKGAIWVLAEDATTFGGRGWVRCTTGGTAEELVGGITSADEGTETIDCTGQIQFQAAVAAQALVLVEVDFTREP